MGPEGEILISRIPAVDDVPLGALKGDEDESGDGDGYVVPVAEFNSSV